MRGKRTIPILNVSCVDNAEVLTFSTGSLKSHFDCSDAKLYEKLADAIYTSDSFFHLYLSTHPKIAVHISGRADKLAGHREWLLKQVKNTLNDEHVLNG